MDIKDYDEKIKKEAEFWDNKVLPYDIHRKDKRIDKPTEMWDDNEVNNLLRGKYLNEIIMHGRKVDGNILELGSGHGFLCYEISKSNKAQKILGIDISKKRFEHAEKYYNDRKNIEKLSEVISKIDDLNYCSLNEDYYQFIFTWDTLHHIVNLDHLFQEVNKSLQKEGYFFVFDHIGKSSLGWLIYIMLWMVLPTYETYFEKYRKIKNKISKKTENTGDNDIQSPFEDISSTKIINSMKNNFVIEDTSYLLSFSHYLIPKLRVKKNSIFVKLLLITEKFFIKLHLLNPEYVFIKARKKM